MCKVTKKQQTGSWQKTFLEALEKGHKIALNTRRHNKSAMFAAQRKLYVELYGAPRTSINDGLKREYFELGDGRVIMFASPHKE